MKIAYLGKIQLSDTDLPYLNAAQKDADITYLLEITPRFLKGPAFNIDKIYGKTGIFKAVEAYPQFEKLASFIDIDKFYVVNTAGHLWQLKAFWTNLLLLFFIMRHGFNVIHVLWPLNVYEFILYFLRRCMILTVHDPFPHSGLDTFIVRLRRKFAFWLIPRFIILNKVQKQNFIDFYKIREDRVVESHISCCTYLQTIKPKPDVQTGGKKYILFTGKISEYKGLDYLLPAMVRVHEAYPDVSLIVAGSGTFHFDISKYETFDYIEFRNRYIPDNELVGLINNSEFLVCPYTDATQSGVIMSAFAFAKPVIATNVGGLPDMLGNGKYGMVVERKNINSLAESIVRLLSDDVLLKLLSDNIKSDYLTGGNSWNMIAADINNEYFKVNS